MSCSHAVPRTTTHSFIGGDTMCTTIVHCGLKLQSEGAKLQVYEALFALGLEGSVITTVCPLGESGRWAACPFYKP